MVSKFELSKQPIPVMHPSEEGGNSQFDPWILWVTFRRCWTWGVPIGALLAAMTSYYVVQSFIPQYQASALLEANQDYLVYQGVMPTISNLVSSERPLIYHAIVLDPVLEDPDVRKAQSLSDPASADINLRKNLRVGSPGSRGQLTISYQDSNRAAAAYVCNAVVESYLRQRESFDNHRMTNLKRWIDPEIGNWQRIVEAQQIVVQDLSQRLLGYSPGDKIDAIESNSNYSLLEDLRSQITDLNVEIALFDAQTNMSESITQQQSAPVVPEAISPDLIVERAEPTETQIAELVGMDSKVKEAQSMIARYKQRLLTMKEDDLIRVRKEYTQEVEGWLQEWNENLQTAKKDARERAIAALNEQADRDLERRKLEAQKSAEQTRKDYVGRQLASKANRTREREQLQIRLDVLEAEYEKEKSRLEEFGGASAELHFAQSELEIANTVLTQLRERSAQIETEENQDGSVRLLAAATEPSRPMESLPFKKLFVYASGAFCVPFLFGFLWEYKTQRITDSSAIDRTISLAPIMGEVAKLPPGSSDHRGRRLFEESIDTLRANLFLSLKTKDTRSIAVVSSMSGEGKSSVASQLAISIAKATGETVLLVDADLRCPDQHEIFGLENNRGLCGVLGKDSSLSEVVDSSLGNLIHVLPAGRLNCSPHRLITTDGMKSFIGQALESYSYVIIDTAPVLSAGETLAVASSTDATLVCVMRDVSRIDNVNRTTRRLEAAGANIVGTVFSGVAPRQYAYRYGNYHYAVASEVSS